MSSRRGKKIAVFLTPLIIFLVILEESRVDEYSTGLWQFIGRRVMNQPSPETVSNYDDDNLELPGDTVFTTGPWVPEEIMKSNLGVNQNIKFQHYTYQEVARSVYEISRELEDEVSLTGAWEAWKALRPWAFRADLWRYMILWSKGGMYLDSKVRLTAPIGMWAALSDDESLAVCQDHDVSWHSEKLDKDVHFLWNGAMSGCRRSPVLLQAIRLAVGTIQERGYVLPAEEPALKQQLPDRLDLSITGPALLGYTVEVMNTALDAPGNRVRVPCKSDGSGSTFGMYMKGADTKLIEFDYSEYNKVYEGSKRYGELYKAGHVYCDSESQPADEKDLKPCNLESFLTKEDLE